MPRPSFPENQPSRPPANRGTALPDRLLGRKTPPERKRILLVGVLIALLFAGAAVTGALAGYGSAMRERASRQAAQGVLNAQEQYELALQDLQAGRFEVARQRLDWVLRQDPSFPGAADHMLEVMRVLYATATPTQPPSTLTPTPTRDLRPIQDLFSHARGLIAAGDWSAAIQALVDLRGADPNFLPAKVDGMLYLALRNRGVENILNNNNLEGGSYDLALAERFAPLDVAASQARELARLYMYGSAFWEAYPEQAVYYFSQVAAAAPNLRDASGWTAAARYRAALEQYGDWLAAKEEWCSAQEQYDLALSMGSEPGLLAKRDQAIQACSPATETPEPSPTATITDTLTATPTIEIFPTWPVDSETPTPSLTPTMPAVPPTETPTPPLVETTTPTQELPPTETPTVEAPVETPATAEPSATSSAGTDFSTPSPDPTGGPPSNPQSSALKPLPWLGTFRRPLERLRLPLWSDDES